MEKRALVKFGNEVFNEISNVSWGSSILILDETHFEAIPFIAALLGNSVPPAKVRFVSFQTLNVPFKTQKLDPDSPLSELNYVVDRLREEVASYGVIVHHYLPRLVIKEDETSILNLLTLWALQTKSQSLVEFYTLSPEAFPSFERKIRSIMDGTIVIAQSKLEPRQLAFSVEGVCKTQYSLRDFPYVLRGNELLIKWGDRYTNYLQVEEIEKIEQKVDFLKDNLDTVKTFPTDIPPVGLSLQERWFFTQVVGKPLREVRNLFPEKFDEILKFIARWNIANFLAFEKEELPRKPRPARKDLRLINRLALKLPLSVSCRLLSKSPSSFVTRDVYRALRTSIELFLQHSTAGGGRADEVTSLERLIQEGAARITALEKLKRNNESPDVEFDLKHLSKTIALSLYVMFGHKSRPEVARKAENMWEIRIRDCPLCEGLDCENALCHMVEPTVIGACSVLFKKAFSCEEVRCKAMGDEDCVFMLKMSEDAGWAIPQRG